MDGRTKEKGERRRDEGWEREWTVKTGGVTEERTVRGGWEGERVPPSFICQ